MWPLPYQNKQKLVTPPKQHPTAQFGKLTGLREKLPYGEAVLYAQIPESTTCFTIFGGEHGWYKAWTLDRLNQV